MATKTQTPKPKSTARWNPHLPNPNPDLQIQNPNQRQEFHRLKSSNFKPKSSFVCRWWENFFTIGLAISLFFFFIVILRYGVPRPISSHFKSRAGGGGVEPVAYYQLQDGTVPPVPVVVSGVEASLFQSEAASVKIKNKNLNVNIFAVEGKGRREKKPGLSWIEIWVEGEIWVLKEKDLRR